MDYVSKHNERVDRIRRLRLENLKKKQEEKKKEKEKKFHLDEAKRMGVVNKNMERIMSQRALADHRMGIANVKKATKDLKKKFMPTSEKDIEENIQSRFEELSKPFRNSPGGYKRKKKSKKKSKRKSKNKRSKCGGKTKSKRKSKKKKSKCR